MARFADDTIHLLIGGLACRSLRGTPLTLKVDSVDEFLEEMHRITSATTNVEKKTNGNGKMEKRDI